MKGKKVRPGVYEARRKVTLTHLDKKVEVLDALCTIATREDEIGGWTLEVEVQDGERRITLASCGDEIYQTKREVVKVLNTGVLDKWEYHQHLGWCI